MSSEIINVHIGEAKVGSEGQTLSALLGSCVGVGLIWPAKKSCALAHCLLDIAPESGVKHSAKYVSLAIPIMLRELGAEEADYKSIRAVVAGGANMTLPDSTDPKNLVGVRNYKAAFSTLRSLKLKVFLEDTGGTLGRTVSIDCATGEVKIKMIPRSDAA